MTKLKLGVAGIATLAVLGGATAAGLAYANPSTPAPPPSTTPSAGPTDQTRPKQNQQGHGSGHRLLGRALHGEATVKGGKKTGGETRVLVFQRGTVTKISSESVEVESVDGYTATYAVNDQVRVRSGRERGSLGDVKAGQRVRLLAVKEAQTITAKRINIHS